VVQTYHLPMFFWHGHQYQGASCTPPVSSLPRLWLLRFTQLSSAMGATASDQSPVHRRRYPSAADFFFRGTVSTAI